MPIHKLPIDDLLRRFVVDDSFAVRLIVFNLANIGNL